MRTTAAVSLSLSLVIAATACGKKKAEPEATAPADNAAPSRGAGSASDTPTAGEPGLKARLVAAASDVFAPGKTGFKFENYGNDDGIENLTAVEVQRMFGKAVCSDDVPDGCILTPPAQKWMEDTNKAMSGGHCEGLASLALLFELGKAAPKDFGAPAAFELELANNPKLQHEIAYWFATQFVSPMDNAEIRTLTPNEVVEKLQAAFKSSAESFTIGIYMPDGSLGHATTPYAIVDKDDHTTWILHYDNNFPGEERHIEVDRKANTWKYFTSADPKEPGSLYEGTASTHTLTIAPTSVRTGPMKCSFCGDIDPAAAADNGTPKAGMRQIIMDGDADLLVTDSHGKQTGHVGGKLVNEIAGASVIPVKAKTPRGSEHEPIYDLPLGDTLKVTLDGSTLDRKEPTDVSLIAPGYTMGVYRVELSPHEQDTITFSADWREVSYETAQDETPDLEIGVETSGADYTFEIHASGEAGGQRVDLVLDAKAGTLSVGASAKDGETSYEVIIHRVDAHGEQVFKHAAIPEAAGDRAVFHYAEWKGNAHPMKVGIDKGGDGKVDSTEDLGDDD